MQSTAVSERGDEFDPLSHRAVPISGMNTYNLDTRKSRDNLSSMSTRSVHSIDSSDSSPTESETRDSSPSSEKATGLAERRAKKRTAASKCRAKHRSHAKNLQDAFEQSFISKCTLAMPTTDAEGGSDIFGRLCAAKPPSTLSLQIAACFQQEKGGAHFSDDDRFW